MSNITRREWLNCTAAAATAGLYLAPRRADAAETAAPISEETAAQGLAAPDLGLTAVGAVRPRKAAEIEASPLGVGFETLDRRHFDPHKTFPYMAELGVKWARCQTGWGRTETVKGKFDFAWLDDVVDGLLKLGVQPWFNLGYGNQLYTPEAKSEAAVGFVPTNSDEAKAAWVRYVEQIAARYAARVKVWEIWNEPNIENFWKPKKPDPAAYVELVRMTAPRIRKLVPDAVIVGAALAGVPIGYLKGCMEAGLGELVDKISYHPYRENPESNYEKEVAAMRALAKRPDGRPIPLWQGENGAPSVPGGAGALAKAAWNETRQAKWLLRRILGDLRLGIELTSYFLIVDLVGYRNSTNYKGLLRGTTYAPKPAYRAYQHVCALFDAESKRADLPMTVEGGGDAAVLRTAFRRRGRPLYVYWTPAPLMKDADFKLGKLDVTVPDAPGAKLEKPVLADLLTGKVHSLPAAARQDGRWTFTALPLADYPLLLTDAEAVR